MQEQLHRNYQVTVLQLVAGTILYFHCPLTILYWEAFYQNNIKTFDEIECII